MKNYCLILFLILCCSAYSQNNNFKKPNYKKIEKRIKKHNSNLFYNSLIVRYLRGDTTLTLEEKRHLYYGFTFNDQYSPYADSDYSDSLIAIIKKEKHDTNELKKIIRFGDSVLVFNPFSLLALNQQLYALEKIGDKNYFNIKITQIEIIIDVLMSSGNGKSKKDAFYVIDIDHEYFLLSLLGYNFAGSQSLIEHYDYLEVAENEKGIEGLYFDVSPCLNSLSEMFKEQN